MAYVFCLTLLMLSLDRGSLDAPNVDFQSIIHTGIYIQLCKTIVVDLYGDIESGLFIYL